MNKHRIKELVEEIRRRTDKEAKFIKEIMRLNKIITKLQNNKKLGDELK